MRVRKLKDGVYWMGAVDWDRRLFDSLIPLPDGTSYNAYLVQGSEKTALLDTVDPSKTSVLLSQLEDFKNIDYVVAHHAEQDHSGALPVVLEKYPGAKVLTTPKGKAFLIDLLKIEEDRFVTVKDGETVSLGDRTLEFIYTPWVHWPETMVTYLQEDRILFSCDFFGSHLATSDLYVTDEARAYEAAKRYYAEIMMPFRRFIVKNLAKLEGYEIDLIATSHGPVYREPDFILEAYKRWIADKPENLVIVPYISMHGSTQLMVEHLVAGFADRGVRVEQFDLSATDLGKLAIALVDAATIVIGTPTFLEGPHPSVVYACVLVNALKPKLRFATVVGSYGWNSKAIEQIAGLMPNLKVEMLEPVLCKGLPGAADFQKLDDLAASIAGKHRELGLM